MIHGGDIYTEGVFKGKKLIDYSSNINPLGVPKTFLSNINKAVKNLEVYPDVSYRKINKSIENYLKIKNMGIVLGNGASEIIELSVSLFKRILIVVPSYIEYEINARRHNVDIIYSYLNSDMDIDYKDIMSKFKEVEAIIIGNPNNPNGGIINKDKFKYILNFAEKNKKTIIIDEAFVEFTGNTNFSFTQEAEQYNCLFIIRAMTKFFAMPGIRFGYGITKNKGIINKIKEKQNPWNINCFAEIAAIKCLSDKKYIEESLLWIKSARGNFINGLQDISFIEKVFYPHANFVLIKLKKITGETLYELLLQEGFVIRRAKNFKGLDDSFVRFAIKDDRLNESFIKVLKGVEGKI